MATAAMTTYYCTYQSPVGPLLLTSDGLALTGLQTSSDKGPPSVAADWIENERAAPLPAATAQLAGYFDGTLQAFSLSLRPAGTEFQRAVWAQLCLIPFGETVSYGELAGRLGNRNASRAVGMANAKNPIGIIIPCHRVIGADHSLTGYAGGLDLKRALLEHEGQWTPAGAPPRGWRGRQLPLGFSS